MSVASPKPEGPYCPIRPRTLREFFREPDLPEGAAWARSFVFLIAAGVLFAVVLHLLPIEEQANRVVARLAAPMLDAWYPRTGQNMITVVLVDDDDLDAYGATWPLRYEFHARRLREIAGLNPQDGKVRVDANGRPAWKPKAIFIDILFLDQRRDQHPKVLQDTFCELKAANIQVFLASLYWTGEKYPRTEQIAPREPGSCATQVSVARTDDTFDHSAWTYPLFSGEGAYVMPTASAAIYTALVQPRDGQLSAPALRDAADLNVRAKLALIWGATPHPFNVGWMRSIEKTGAISTVKERCTKSWMSRLGLNVLGLSLKTAVDDSRREPPLCPYNRVLPSRIFQDRDLYEKDLQQALDDRIVMYGVSVQSAEDRIRSPLHGVLPGPHLHAMALDNMLSFNGRAKRYEKFDLLEPRSSGTVFTFIAILVLTTLMTAGRRLRPKIDQGLAERWIDYVYRYREPRIKIYPFGVLRRRYFACVHIYRGVRFFLALVLYGTVAFAIAWVGYAGFALGPLVWIKYALFFILAHFIHLGPALETWVSSVLHHRHRIANLDTIDQFKAEAKKTLTSTSHESH